MIVGVPTEIKPDEYRVAITPIGVRELSEHGHQVLIQRGAGEGSAISDADFEAQGARILPTAEAVFGDAEMILGVKEPQPGEVELLRSLEAFIENNGNWERAARQLYCHRHTLRYRIRKIEELTGRDLSRATDRIELWLALRARELVR